MQETVVFNLKPCNFFDMLAKKSVDKGPGLFYSSLSVMLNQQQPLFILHFCVKEAWCGPAFPKPSQKFGNKVSIVYTLNTGVIVGAMGFRNEYDGHTLEGALDQHEKLSGNRTKSATIDRGYRGKTRIGETMINQNGLFKTRLD